MSWIQTRGGLAFDYLTMDPLTITIDDIASSLSKQCRFGGHTIRFYSVAEHSVLVSQCVPPEHAVTALLHDATEAYLLDLPRPVKHLPALAGYRELEDRLWGVIADKFGLPRDMPPCVKEADNRVLLAEKEVVLAHSAPRAWTWATGLEPADVQIRELDPASARFDFLARFYDLRP